MICSNCKNPIPENSKECEWCGNKVVVKDDFNNLVHLSAQSDLDDEIIRLLQNGQAILAVKFKKDNSNLSLKESKEYVDSLIAKNGFKKQGCFIATACYGNYESPEVLEFRKFRDTVLLKSYYGRLFISTYYFISPPFANFLSKSEKTKRIVRKVILAPILNLIKK